MTDTSFKVKNGLVVNTDLLVADNINRRIGVKTSTPGVSIDAINGTDALGLPSGNTAQRPASPVNGYIRHNSELGIIETYVQDQWIVSAAPNTGAPTWSLINATNISFDTTANNKISYANNAISLVLGSQVALTANATTVVFNNVTANNTNSNTLNSNTLVVGNSSANLVANSTTLKITNSSASIIISSPNTAQISSGTHYLNANGSYVSLVFAPSGSNTQIQFNDSGVFSATAGLVWNKTTNNLTVANTVIASSFQGNLTGNANTVTNITSGQIVTALAYTPTPPTGNNASGVWPISINGNANTVTNGIYSTGSYGNPSWITSLDGSKLTGTVNANTVPWSGVSGKPASFTPSTHTHPISDVTNLQTILDAKVDDSEVGTSSNQIVRLDSSGKIPAVVNPTKAYGSFYWDGSAVVITDSYNVTSIVRNSSGNFTINFTNALPNANYVLIGNTNSPSASGLYALCIHSNISGGAPSLKSTTQCKVATVADTYGAYSNFVVIG